MEKEQREIRVIEIADPAEGQFALSMLGDLVIYKNSEWVLWLERT